MPPCDSRTVWSSTGGDQRHQPAPKTTVTQSLPPQQQTAYLYHESKGRGGKGVTLVKNLVLTATDLQALSKTIKQAVGSGGTVKESVIEIQGEQREKVAEVLRRLGYKVKMAGG